MRILIVGASGTIGRAVAEALAARHEIVGVSRSTQPVRVDITDAESIRAMYRAVGPLDAVISTAGQARFKPLAELSDDDFAFSLRDKLMGQVNLVRLGFGPVRENGVFVVTSGVLARSPVRGSAAVSLVNAGLEGFMRAAALEAPGGVRVNAVSPPWVTETLLALGMDTSAGLPAKTVAQSYVQAVEGDRNGAVFEPAAPK
jgi:NAD(P)-dependent dehydrogenase (short-subunit alcohol dehydrogenase family)